MDKLTSKERSERNKLLTMRWILAFIIVSLCMFQLCLTYRGMDQPVAMDMAQIGRQIARGEGFTSKFLRPIDVWDQNKENKGKALDFEHFQDTNHAPLYPYVLAGAIKACGFDDFQAKRMNETESNVYAGDRIIAATSTAFFLIALLLAYTLFTRLFDEVVAATTVALMGLSELVLQYALSGLPQMLMMCFVLGAMHCLVSAVQANTENKAPRVVLWSLAMYILLALLCLTCRMSMWCAIGMMVFTGIYFTPRGMYAAIGAAVLAILVILPTVLQLAPTGGMEKKLMYAIFNGFGSDGAEMLMRSATTEAMSFNSSNFFLRLLGYTFAQFNSMYINMGAIVTTPFFLLALLNKFRKTSVQACKWAVFAMWLASCAGMALFGENETISASQQAILFTPFFVAFGTALVFIFLARMQLGQAYNGIRGLAIAAMLVISSGLFLFQLPKQLYMGIWTSARGIPHFPPYYPAAMNGKLHNMTNEKDLVVTDQPWGVAWYADRKALWMPRSLEELTRNLEPIFHRAGQDVQGFLITPSSHSMQTGGISGVIREAGDFAPLALEGKLLLLAPRHNMAFAELFTTNANPKSTARPLASLVSSQGIYRHRNFLLGAEMVYYSREDVSEKNK